MLLFPSSQHSRVSLASFITRVVVPATMLLPLTAQAWWWKQPNYGFRIEGEAQNAAYQAGQSARIDGKVTYKHAHSHGNKPIPSSVWNDTEIQFWFPDKITNVSSQVTFDPRRGDFRFNTPALDPAKANQLIVTIGKARPQWVRDLQKVQAKLDRRVLHLNHRIAQLTGRLPATLLTEIIALRCLLYTSDAADE